MGDTKQLNHQPSSKVDYYEILQVDDNSTTSEMVTAYHQQCLKFHPDRHPKDPAARQRLDAVQEAYLVLSDAHRRASYDRWRAAGLDLPFTLWERTETVLHWYVPKKPTPELVGACISSPSPSSSSKDEEKRIRFRQYRL